MSKARVQYEYFLKYLFKLYFQDILMNYTLDVLKDTNVQHKPGKKDQPLGVMFLTGEFHNMTKPAIQIW